MLRIRRDAFVGPGCEETAERVVAREMLIIVVGCQSIVPWNNLRGHGRSERDGGWIAQPPVVVGKRHEDRSHLVLRVSASRHPINPRALKGWRNSSRDRDVRYGESRYPRRKSTASTPAWWPPWGGVRLRA